MEDDSTSLGEYVAIEHTPKQQTGHLNGPIPDHCRYLKFQSCAHKYYKHCVNIDHYGFDGESSQTHSDHSFALVGSSAILQCSARQPRALVSGLSVEY